MSWINRAGKGDDKDPKKESAPAPRGKGLVVQKEEGIETYKESIGLLQQFADAGLRKLAEDPDSDYNLRQQSMMDVAEYKISSGRGHIIHIRVPGQPEAKALQKQIKEFLNLEKDQKNPLTRQKRKELRDGHPVYDIALKVGKDGLSPERTKEILEGTLKQMDITPDWNLHYVKSDRETNRAIAEGETELREALEAEERDAAKRARRGEKIDDGLSPGEIKAQRQRRLDDPERGDFGR